MTSREHRDRSVEIHKLNEIETKVEHILRHLHESATEQQLETIMATLAETNAQLAAQADANAQLIDAANRLIAQNDVTHQQLADLKAQVEAGTAATPEDLQAIIDGSKTVTDASKAETDAINADLAKDPPPTPTP